MLKGYTFGITDDNKLICNKDIFYSHPHILEESYKIVGLLKKYNKTNFVEFWFLSTDDCEILATEKQNKMSFLKKHGINVSLQ